jgi:membrane-associated phospholipid phosphatase
MKGNAVRSWLAVMMFIGIGFAEPQLATPATVPETMTAASPSAQASQDEDDTASRGVMLKLLPRDILQDQQALFGMPFRTGERQWKNLVPFSALMVGLVATDTAFEGHVTSGATTASRFRILSDAGLATAVGIGGGMYLWGRFASNEHVREAGYLSGEAAIDAYVDTSLIKLVAGRDRPFTANGRGKFFDGGTSFPSQHAAVSWAIASVIAHEYPGPATKFLSYGLAGAVSLARVEGHQHFVSDAVIGSIVGWYIGQQVYRARSNDADIDPRKWGKFEKDENSETERAVSQMGSTYVPLESWIYESLERLAAMGYGHTGSAVMRPWTRLDSARFLAEAQENGAEDDPVVAPLIFALRDELSRETNLREGGRNQSSQVESLYGRFIGISGTPLRDSFHFAQTLVDDNGRPYGERVNGIAGVSARAEAGSLAY